jgi:hypothetical protein
MATSVAPASASELFALSQGKPCVGPEQCHWCYAPCARRWVHDDPAPVPFVKSLQGAKNPSGMFVCEGCWMYRRKRLTVYKLNGDFKDGRSPREHSWLITADSARVIDEKDGPELYEILINPPGPFVLSLRQNADTHIHLARVAVPDKPNTFLHFTVDNVAHKYSPYELEQAAVSGVEGKEPGVRALSLLFGPPPRRERKQLQPRQAAKEIRA